ncbi:hypothetical protein NN3_50690 [Nocardia neocaledoniensis NBRC 108232]|uniref:hypothetical protein n=1 Tax=Nocardia neocaledoniensis TaxID=236511 RepID=UPI001192A5CC|nr:hypothetical protein [Nocardia neocaledoniensis]GEM34062.1 hypothetical protein NN3_50690 [Nocardia neocaledoniensis NBRC 108232]
MRPDMQAGGEDGPLFAQCRRPDLRHRRVDGVLAHGLFGVVEEADHHRVGRHDGPLERSEQIVAVRFPRGDRGRVGDPPEKFDERDPDIRGELVTCEQSRDDMRRRRGGRRRESLVQHGAVEMVERGLPCRRVHRGEGSQVRRGVGRRAVGVAERTPVDLVEHAPMVPSRAAAAEPPWLGRGICRAWRRM